MVNKTDLSEILQPMKFWTITTLIIASFLILIIGFILMLIMNQRKKDKFKSLYELELQKEVLSKHYEYLLKYANDIILLVGRDHQIVDCNEKAILTYGYSKEELMGMKIDQLAAPGFSEILDNRMQEIMLKQGLVFESAQQKKDGIIFPIEISSRTISIENKTFFQSIIRDITERKQAQTAILESENRFRSVTENAPIGIGIARKGIHIYANKSYARLFGYSDPDEITGTKLINFIHPDFRQEIMEQNQKRENKYRVRNDFEMKGLRKDGTSFPFYANVTLIQLSDGPATLGFFQDLTAQKNAQSALVKSEKRYRMLFTSMVEGFALHDVVCDDAGKVVNYRFLDINPAFEKLTGLKANEIIGRNVTEVLPDLEKVWIDRYGHVALSGEPITFEQFNTSLGKYYRIMAFSPAKKQFAVLFEDITESRKIQEEIRQLNLELEQRVANRTADLEIANKELESFSYSVSHDLRAPLRSLDGFSQAILEDYAALLNEQGKNYLNRIRAASQKMAHLIDDLLRLSRISRQAMRYETVDLSEMVGSIGKDMLSEYPSIPYQMKITPGILVKADSALIRIAMENLLSNAFKFSGKTENPCIHFGITEIGQDQTRELFICDNGAGFDMKYAGKLFGVFQRLHTLEEFPGTGIGLTIVHRIIQRHKGSIRAESVIGEKTCFYFKLPDIDKQT
jgi:PAS domain S-box-containing protein